ncbi:SemiSWEET family sugar transporter [Paludibacterium purpuratum]|uniref:MtN3 and saliva related transmembrane protein n=1 Tax=Paludibacterium purpuratum TaxID=1144873 RepID=A0A4R7B0Z5_9NEIS|nr:SemiSWEET family transporter [Paludibacterium purpuratum]TDR72993.1 MtN3 and saliva related transmembrane protein [Paludibacterium purpuratum]
MALGDKRLRWLQRYMNCIGPLGNLMFYFQAYEIFVSRSAGAVSFTGFAISVVGLSSWLIYGIAIRNTPLIVANAVGVAGALTVLAGLLRYAGA